MNRSRTRAAPPLSLLAILAFFAATAQETGVEGSPRTYPFADRGELVLTVPASWRETVETPAPEDGVLALNLQFESEKPLEWAFVVQAFWNADRSAPTADDELREEVKRTGQRFRGHVVERQIPILEARGKETLLYYFSVTDTEKKPGEYLFLTQGTARIGRVLAAFTILSNGERAEIERRALDVLLEATHRRREAP